MQDKNLLKLKGKQVLVTGGCGFIGSEIVKQLISQNPKKIVVFCRDESDSFFMKRELSNPIVEFVIGDIRSYSSLRVSTGCMC